MTNPAIASTPGGNFRMAGDLSKASHDSTANQWFGESQMESYRALAFEITDSLLREALKDLKGTPDPKLKDVLNALKSIRPVATA